jgi:nicotinate-nucleotide adenylyltransferase
MNRHRIGLLGGTFNPVHRGHIELGLKVREAFGLDRILYILSARPPHKQSRKIPGATVRFRMLEKALKPYPKLVPCDLEIKRPEPSWTVDTITELKARFPGDRFYFITGSEGFLKIRTWKEYRKVLESVSVIIVVRRADHLRKVETILREEAVPFTVGRKPAPAFPGAYIYQYPSSHLTLSSTIIRRRIRLHQDVRGVVDQKNIAEVYKLYENQ